MKPDLEDTLRDQILELETALIACTQIMDSNFLDVPLWIRDLVDSANPQGGNDESY